MDFNNSLEKSTISSKKFYDELKSRGYNSVIDEHDINGSWMHYQQLETLKSQI